MPDTTHPAGPTHRDSEGCLRVANHWGFNSFATEEDARRYSAALRRNGAKFYVWRLSDGTYDAAAVEMLPDDPDSPPWWQDAVLVGEYTAHGRQRRRG